MSGSLIAYAKVEVAAAMADKFACACSYPHCLFFLDMLQSKEFRSAIARTDITVSICAIVVSSAEVVQMTSEHL